MFLMPDGKCLNLEIKGSEKTPNYVILSIAKDLKKFRKRVTFGLLKDSLVTMFPRNDTNRSFLQSLRLSKSSLIQF